MGWWWVNRILVSAPDPGTRGLGTGLDNMKSISFSYGNILLPRTSLQSTLKQTWMFQCQCPRCSDPSELGLHYSMINKVSWIDFISDFRNGVCDCVIANYVLEQNSGCKFHTLLQRHQDEYFHEQQYSPPPPSPPPPQHSVRIWSKWLPHWIYSKSWH